MSVITNCIMQRKKTQENASKNVFRRLSEFRPKIEINSKDIPSSLMSMSPKKNNTKTTNDPPAFQRLYELGKNKTPYIHPDENYAYVPQINKRKLPAV